MEWLIVLVIGAIIGTLAGFLVQGIHMPQSLTIAVAIIGALAGGAIFRITQVDLFGTWSLYLTSAMVSFGLLAGAILVHLLTSSEKRV
jgi:uncharacterized membrane protein YeaQ/YmgE (transglycosylase-associated protein family)